ncbi:MAG TPA: hypothetical protein VF423_14825 [Actinomycetes bacterium]
MNHLEDRLRTELRQEADAVRTSPDAWQENRRRLAASQRRRVARVLTTAAAVIVVLLVGGLIVVATNGADGGPPASGGGDDPFTERFLLGPPVQVETLEVDGVPTVHEAALSDMTGKGPNLCDHVEAASSGFGSCTIREPDADDPAVAFDWLSSSSGGSDTRGILAGVDSRVMTVQIWMDNGDMTLADLKPGGWEDTKLFALTVPADGPRPQRLVAYSDASGKSLQSVDLVDRFGDGWLPRGGKTCTGAATATWRQPRRGGTGDDVSVVLWSGSVKVTLAESDTAGSTCLGLGPSPLAASTPLDAHLVVAVIAPEAEFYEVRQPPPGLQTALYPVSGTPWQVLVASVPQQSTFGDTEIVVLDSSDGVLDRLFLDQLASP